MDALAQHLQDDVDATFLSVDAKWRFWTSSSQFGKRDQNNYSAKRKGKTSAMGKELFSPCLHEGCDGFLSIRSAVKANRNRPELLGAQIQQKNPANRTLDSLAIPRRRIYKRPSQLQTHGFECLSCQKTSPWTPVTMRRSRKQIATRVAARLVEEHKAEAAAALDLSKPKAHLVISK